MENDAFSISSLTIDPEVSELGGPVRIIMDFISPHDLHDAIWRVYYQVDTIRKRKKFEVCALSPMDFVSGVNRIEINIPSIEVESSSSVTAGVLLLALTHATEELLGINMIVQVIQKEGRLFKTIFSPLE